MSLTSTLMFAESLPLSLRMSPKICVTSVIMIHPAFYQADVINNELDHYLLYFFKEFFPKRRGDVRIRV